MKPRNLKRAEMTRLNFDWFLVLVLLNLILIQ